MHLVMLLLSLYYGPQTQMLSCLIFLWRVILLPGVLVSRQIFSMSVMRCYLFRGETDTLVIPDYFMLLSQIFLTQKHPIDTPVDTAKNRSGSMNV